MIHTPIHSTTILGVRLGRKVAMGGDGQVTMGEMQLKSRAVKVRAFAGEKVLGGFAGAVADALNLFDKFEAKLEEYSQNLQRAAVELAKEWRTDKYLRELDAFLALMDRRNSYILSGSGDVIDPEDNVISIGSGSGYAMAAARALIMAGEKDSKVVVKTALEITADLCIYSNDQLTILELK
ncbi:MAG: ATP-dependent protease subunit HslV [Calditrichaeota bacterium]|nr:ATP-dependent protease subunit HslV [Calditrichota bacterium]